MRSSPWSRREFLQTALAVPAFVHLRPSGYGGQARLPLPQNAATDPWQEAARIAARVKEPAFPRRDVDATRFKTINEAIDACSAAGGGRVVVPAGSFTTGPIRLKSRVNLHLSEGAVLKFSTEPKDYLPVVYTRFEGVELMNYSPFIYAYDQQDIAITGTGTLDGQADNAHWWDWTRRAVTSRRRLMDPATARMPVADRVFGEDSYLRPNFIQPYRCRNVFIEGITIRNSPMWEIHPVLSTNVIVRGVTVNTHGPNNDGCNPESCRDVLIERCSFDTGDDCIALKSGRNDDGRRVNVAVENVVIRDCSMKDGHGGVTIGSEISGGARNVFAERCRMDSPNLNIALRFKTNSVRGGVVERIFMRDVTIGQVGQAVISVDFQYEEGDAGKFPPTVRDIEVRNVTSQKSRNALALRGYSYAPVTNVRLTDCRFDNVAQADILEHVKDLRFDNVRVNGTVRNETVSI
jgi:polygalacturonase